MNLAEYIPVTQDDNDYWTHDIPLFVGMFPYYRNQPRMVQGKIHLSEESFSHGLSSEIIPLHHKKGTRFYVNMHPYILEPELFITIGLYPQPKQYADQQEAIGETLSAPQVKGMRQAQIGNAQAWYYPQDKVIVLWECFLYSSMRKSLTEDLHIPQMWRVFEKWLIMQFPEATCLVTPFNDPIANTIEEYQQFLRSLDFKPVAKEAVFEKEINRTTL